MRERLIDIAEANGIPFIDRYDEIGLVPEVYDEDKIFGIVEYFAAAFDGELVLYGGQTATERIYGFKQIRDITTDLDFVCTDEGLSRLVTSPGLFYHRKYDIIFSSRDNVPLSFARDHIHDWPVDEGFFRTAETVRGFHWPVRCCSREYSIMLKLRRMNERIDRGDSPFGKDALDIINMTTAPYIRADLEPIDFSFLGELLSRSVRVDGERRKRLESFIAIYTDHLTELERSYFARVLEAFSELRRTSWKC